MTQIHFQTWKNAHPAIDPLLHYPEGSCCGWARIHATWDEKKGSHLLHHTCAFALDFQSGDIYTDCSKKKIWIKCLFLTVGYPFLGIAKTIYHLALPISIPLEIFKVIYEGFGQESAKILGKKAVIKVGHNMADIFRTPVYSIAMAIVVLAGVIIGPFAPKRLYDLRALAGKIENSLNRGEETFWTRAPCFQPLANIMTIDSENYVKPDTQYDSDPVLHGLNNLVRSYVKYRRKNINLFDDFGRTLHLDATYISPAIA